MEGGKNINLLNNLQIEDSNVLTHNATTDSLSATLTNPHTPASAANAATLQKQLHSAGHQNALLHWEPLLVTTT